MHRFIIVALGALAVASCDRFPDNGVQIGGMLPLEDDCTIDPGTELRRSSGLWDVSQRITSNTNPRQGIPNKSNAYVITPLLESYLISRATDIQAEQNNTQVTQYEITLETPDGMTLELGDLPNPYSVNTSAVLPANVDNDVTLGTASSVAVPSIYMDSVAAAIQAAGFNELIINFRAVSTTRGGFTNRSAPFYWNVRLCGPQFSTNRCLDFCPTPGSGEDLTDEQITILRGSCLPGQDSFPYCSFPPAPEDEEN